MPQVTEANQQLRVASSAILLITCGLRVQSMRARAHACTHLSCWQKKVWAQPVAPARPVCEGA
jgi:hypothetical protein